MNWEKRDLQLAEGVKVAALFLNNLPGRPVHISISAIGREIGQLALLQQHLEKLPKTAQVLSEQIETREAFAVRRIQWTAENYRREHIYPYKWQLVKRAGVERLAGKPQVKVAIDSAWKSLNSSMNNTIEFFPSNELPQVSRQ